MTDAEDPHTEDKAVSIKVTPGLIASALDSQSIRTSFGKLPLADEKSNPVFSFSKSHRESTKKLYMGDELITSEAVVSPGPKYLVRDNISMRTLPKFSFGKGDRVLNGSQRKFDYFDRKDVLSDVTTAHQSIQRTIPNVKFGTSSRFSGEFSSASPGPIYDPKLATSAKGNGKFVLGGRHSGVQGDPLMLFTGTNALVGPGKYSPYREFGESASAPSFPKNMRRTLEARVTSRNQTYESHISSLGPQIRDTKLSSRVAVFGRSTRDHLARTAVFHSLMDTQPVRVRLPHPVLN